MIIIILFVYKSQFSTEIHCTLIYTAFIEEIINNIIFGSSYSEFYLHKHKNLLEIKRKSMHIVKKNIVMFGPVPYIYIIYIHANSE